MFGLKDKVFRNPVVFTSLFLLFGKPAFRHVELAGIGPTTATGNGNITDLGIPNPTAYGVCWNTIGNPTIADPHKDNGAASSTGAFTAYITGLNAGTTYYVRAFAENTAGTAYGDQVNFKTKVALTIAVSPAAAGTTTPAAGSTTNLDDGVARNITAAAATGYHFVNWSATPAGNATFGNPASASTAVTLTGSAMVTANFALDTYAVTYNGNGNTGGTAPPAQTKTYGVDLTLRTNTGNLAKTGYTFAGWKTAADGSGTNYAAGSQYTANAEVTLYAKWTIKTYTLTTVANPAAGGTVTRNPDKANYDHGENVQVLATPNPGYAFTGWSGDLSGTTNPATITMNGNKIVTANFAPIYTVAYNGNGNTGGSPPMDGTAYREGDTVTVLDAGTLEKAGYSFIGWNTAADGTGTSYAPGAQFTMPAANVTLYAQWTVEEPIPTLSEWGMILLISLLAGVTLWRLRRQTGWNKWTAH